LVSGQGVECNGEAERNGKREREPWMVGLGGLHSHLLWALPIKAAGKGFPTADTLEIGILAWS
jgi:hypothetical protein